MDGGGAGSPGPDGGAIHTDSIFRGRGNCLFPAPIKLYDPDGAQERNLADPQIRYPDE
ncbi:hypothetical protein D3C81_2154090 [compost metagenome]